jgi:isopenicillin N synthase-like dioxygenase
MTVRFPIIDLGDYLAGREGAAQAAAAELRRALETVGFYAVVNHGVSWNRVEGIFAEAKRFHDQDAAAKAKLAFSADFTGYVAPSAAVLRTSQVNRNTKGDLNEAYFIERESPPAGADPARAATFVSPNQWPEALPGFRETALDYYDTVERLARALLPLYARALELPEDWFEEAFDWPQASLRLTHYPPLPREDNQFGIAPHTDAGFLTILPQSDVTGLHIRPRGQDWMKAPRVEQGFFINSGDMLKRWSNDRFLSTQHMAVNESDRDRYAAVFFFSPNLDYEMACLPTCQDASHPPRYEPITYRQYRAWFMDSNNRAEAEPRARAEAVGV